MNETAPPTPVGRVSPKGVTRQVPDEPAAMGAEDVGLRCANPTYEGEWLNSTLGEFVRLQRGHDLTASEQQHGDVPIMGSAGQNGTHNTQRLSAAPKQRTKTWDAIRGR